MKPVLCMADPHWTDNPRDAYRLNFMEDFLEVLARRAPEALLILGDLTEAKDKHSAKLVNRIVSLLSSAATICPVAVLMGNHDYHDEGHPFFAFLSHMPNMAWIGKPTLGAELPGKLGPALANTLLLPHTRSYERDWKELLPQMAKFNYVFAHNTFEGANVGFGRELGGIPLDVIPKKAKVIAGDIHVPQTLGPVTYVGAPYTVDYGDDYEPRLLHVQASGVRSVGVGSWPQKRVIEIHDVAELPKARQGDMFRVRMHVPDLQNWRDTHTAILQWADKRGVTARVEPIIAKAATKKRVKIDAAKQTSDGEILDTFAKRHSVAPEILKAGKLLL